jgi:ABC-type sugar transport system ATPase subunit
MYPLPASWHATLAQRTSAEIIVGIRPQTLVPAGQLAAEDRPRGVLSATVTEIEPLIGELLVTCQLDNEHTLVALWPDMENEPLPETRIDLAVDPGTFCLFDPVTEALIPTEKQAQ